MGKGTPKEKRKKEKGLPLLLPSKDHSVLPRYYQGEVVGRFGMAWDGGISKATRTSGNVLKACLRCVTCSHCASPTIREQLLKFLSNCNVHVRTIVQD